MPSVVVLQHVHHETLGSLAEALLAAGLAWRVVELFRDAPTVPDVETAAGLIVLGGPMNVDETLAYPFLVAEVAWIQRALAAGTPILGVCLGSQLLAKAGGARVYPNGEKEIGWRAIELTPAAVDDPLFAGCPTSPMVFHWHGDTFDLPASAVHLASSAVCRNQAFRLGPSAWGLQFHLETTPTMIEAWLAEPGCCRELAALPSSVAADIRRDTPLHSEPLARLAGDVFARFAAACRARPLP